MGYIIEYNCTDCKKKYEFFEGCGMRGTFNFTYLCLRCKKLNQLNAESEIHMGYEEDLSFAILQSELKDDLNKKHKCSKCKKKDQLVLWDTEKAECPKCGKSMKAFQVGFWD